MKTRTRGLPAIACSLNRSPPAVESWKSGAGDPIPSVDEALGKMPSVRKNHPEIDPWGSERVGRRER
jgi:hypothetical protein